MSDIFDKHGGFRRLHSFTLATIVQIDTLRFCRRFLASDPREAGAKFYDPKGRQYDQMTQAARSGRQNIIEGSRVRRKLPITPGRVEGLGRRGKPLTADYVQEYRNRKLAVVEAKAWDKALVVGTPVVMLGLILLLIGCAGVDDIGDDASLSAGQIIVALDPAVNDVFDDRTPMIDEYIRVLTEYAGIDPRWDDISGVSSGDRRILFSSLIMDREYLEKCDLFFVHDDWDDATDPVFDVAFSNNTGRSLRLHGFGIKVESAQQVLYTMGEGRPSEATPVQADYEILPPAVFGADENGVFGLADDFPAYSRSAWDSPRKVPPDGTFRFSLRLKDYRSRMPNTSLLRIVLYSNGRDYVSPPIYILVRW